MVATDVSYYPGCSLDGTAGEYGESVETVARVLGIKLTEVEDWSCCGSSSAHATSEELSIALSARNLKLAEKVGKDVVVPCPSCFQRLKTAEKALLSGKPVVGVGGGYKGNFQIRYITDYLWDATGEETIKSKVVKPLKGLNPVCYYGCLATRPPKITDQKNYEDPQSMDNIMKALGANVKDWSFKTDCCGGSVIFTRPDVAKKLIEKLYRMAEEAGADCIVAACPICQSNLDSRMDEISAETGKKYNLPVYYFSELMGLAFGKTPEKWLNKHLVDPIPLLKQKGLL